LEGSFARAALSVPGVQAQLSRGLGRMRAEVVHKICCLQAAAARHIRSTASAGLFSRPRTAPSHPARGADNRAEVAFGKHKGKLLQTLAREDPSYLEWMLKGETFAPDTVAIVADALKGKFPKRVKAASR
jgi:hypothetical protein